MIFTPFCEKKFFVNLNLNIFEKLKDIQLLKKSPKENKETISSDFSNFQFAGFFRNFSHIAIKKTMKNECTKKNIGSCRI